MSAAVALGLLAALLYGMTDFAARFAGRQVGILKSMLYGNSAAALVTSGFMLWHGLPRADLATWLAAIASNLTGLAATALLYRALVTGSLSVVSPIMATYGGITALLSAASGEALHLVGWLGLTMATMGGVTVANPQAGPRSGPAPHAGIAPAAAAAVLYGLSFWLQGRYVVAHLGALVPTWSYYMLGCIASLAFGMATKQQLRPPPWRVVPLMLGTTAFGCGATLALAAGEVTGEVAVVTVLSALASVVTVLLARIVLKEAVTPVGWLGVTLIVVGLGLLHSR